MPGRDLSTDLQRAARAAPNATIAAIAAAVGCSASTAGRYLRRRPVPPPPRGTPPDRLLARLAADPAPPVRAAALAARNCPPAVLVLAFRTGSRDERRRVAAHPDLPPRLIRWCATNADPQIRAAAAANRNLPEKRFDRLGTNDVVLRAAAGNRSCPPRVLVKLAAFKLDDPHNREGAEIRSLAACNPNCPPDTRTVGGDPAETARVRTARRSDDKALLARAAQDPRSEVRRAAAANPNTPPELLEQLAAGGGVTHETVLRNSNCPPWLLAAAVDSGDRLSCAGVTRNPNTPSELLGRLAAGGATGLVAAGLAANPNTPAAVLEELAAGSDALVVANVARNLNTGSRLMRRLAEHPERRVRAGVARNRRCDTATFLQLAKDTASDVRAAAAERNDCPLPTAARLSADPAAQVRTAAAKGMGLR